MNNHAEDIPLKDKLRILVVEYRVIVTVLAGGCGHFGGIALMG